MEAHISLQHRDLLLDWKEANTVDSDSVDEWGVEV